jgi:hypothetical protein
LIVCDVVAWLLHVQKPYDIELLNTHGGRELQKKMEAPLIWYGFALLGVVWYAVLR